MIVLALGNPFFFQVLPLERIKYLPSYSQTVVDISSRVSGKVTSNASRVFNLKSYVPSSMLLGISPNHTSLLPLKLSNPCSKNFHNTLILYHGSLSAPDHPPNPPRRVQQRQWPRDLLLETV
jgi:hypothetical protein